jgi:hypothetical protein
VIRCQSRKSSLCPEIDFRSVSFLAHSHKSRSIFVTMFGPSKSRATEPEGGSKLAPAGTLDIFNRGARIDTIRHFALIIEHFLSE